MPSYSRQVQIPGKSSQELYDTVSNDIERFVSKSSIGKCEIQRAPAKRELQVSGSMFSATLICNDGEMKLNVKLSMLAAPFRGKLDDSIDRWLSKTFNMTQA